MCQLEAYLISFLELALDLESTAWISNCRDKLYLSTADDLVPAWTRWFIVGNLCELERPGWISHVVWAKFICQSKVHCLILFV